MVTVIYGRDESKNKMSWSNIHNMDEIFEIIKYWSLVSTKNYEINYVKNVIKDFELSKWW